MREDVSDQAFSAWIRVLDEDVIQGEYGYEDGEFTVYPDHWRGLWLEGLTPAAAFKRALDAHGEDRRAQEAERAANWARIVAEERAPPATPDPSDGALGRQGKETLDGR